MGIATHYPLGGWNVNWARLQFVGRRMLDYITLWITQYGYPAIFMLLMLGVVGLPLPDELLLTFVGAAVYKGNLHWAPAALAAVCGSACGITLSYVLGVTAGHGIIEWLARITRHSDEQLNVMRRWFIRRGKWALLVGYFLPGIRHFTAIMAGTSRLPYHTFALFAYCGAVMWSLSFIAFGYFAGKEWAKMTHHMHHILEIVSIVVVVIAAGVWLVRRLRPAGR